MGVETPYFWLGPDADKVSTAASIREHCRNAPVAMIQGMVALHYGIPADEMKSSRRARVVARPRQVAMYLAKQMTCQSLPEIGRRFGNRDHTTVLHAVRQIERLKASDTKIANDVEALREALL